MADGFGDKLVHTTYAWALRRYGAPVLRRLAAVGGWLTRDDPASAEGGILVVGAGGVGKSILADLICGRAEAGDGGEPVGRYAESLTVDRLKLKADDTVEVIVLPGQPHRRTPTWQEYEARLATGGFRGIVIVSAYGYHSLGQYDVEDHRLYAGDRRQFLRDYLAACRDDEVAILGRVLEAAVKSPRKLWLLSVVNKRDLWDNQRADVERHYRDGGYDIAVRRAQEAIGGTRLRHERVAVSLLINRFETARGEVLAKNLAGYAHPDQVESVERLVGALEALRTWEAES